MQLHPKLTNVVSKKDGHYLWSADRSIRFPFKPGSEEKTIEKINSILQRIESIRPISDRELIRGPSTDRVEDRDRETRIAQDTRNRFYEDYHPQPKNPHSALLQEHDSLYSEEKWSPTHPDFVPVRTQVRKDLVRRAKEWEEQQEQPPEVENTDFDAMKLQAGEHYLVAFYSNAPMSTLRQSEAMLDAALEERAEDFATVHAEFTAAAEAKFAAADQRLLAAQQQIIAEREALGISNFEFQPVVPAETNTPADESANNQQETI